MGPSSGHEPLQSGPPHASVGRWTEGATSSFRCVYNPLRTPVSRGPDATKEVWPHAEAHPPRETGELPLLPTEASLPCSRKVREGLSPPIVTPPLGSEVARSQARPRTPRTSPRCPPRTSGGRRCVAQALGTGARRRGARPPEMAPTGQYGTHHPQSVQLGRTLSSDGVRSRASGGQTPTHSPQRQHVSGLTWIMEGFSRPWRPRRVRCPPHRIRRRPSGSWSWTAPPRAPSTRSAHT